MLESGLSGSVRGVLSNEHPYREPGSKTVLTPLIMGSLYYPRKQTSVSSAADCDDAR